MLYNLVERKVVSRYKVQDRFENFNANKKVVTSSNKPDKKVRKNILKSFSQRMRNSSHKEVDFSKGKIQINRFSVDNLEEYLILGGSYGTFEKNKVTKVQQEVLIPFLRVFKIGVSESIELGFTYSNSNFPKPNQQFIEFTEQLFSTQKILNSEFSHLEILPRKESDKYLYILACNECDTLAYYRYDLEKNIIVLWRKLSKIHTGKPFLSAPDLNHSNPCSSQYQ